MKRARLKGKEGNGDATTIHITPRLLIHFSSLAPLMQPEFLHQGGESEGRKEKKRDEGICVRGII